MPTTRATPLAPSPPADLAPAPSATLAPSSAHADDKQPMGVDLTATQLVAAYAIDIIQLLKSLY
jgi:hypothetical protein